jgi:hypothetical protein
MDVWKTEKADSRVQLLAAFAAGRSDSDEPFLETALDDRAASVRQAAAGILATMLGSGLASRMLARADAMLSTKMSGLFRKALVVVCSPPTEVDKTWTRDGIAENPPAGVGKRAHWATSALSLVPPSHWSERFEAQPEALIAGVAHDDYADAVVDGWTQAAARFSNVKGSTAWLTALAGHWMAALNTCEDNALLRTTERLAAVMPKLDRTDAERVIQAAFGFRADRQAMVLGKFLADVPGPWSIEFGKHVLRDAKAAIQSSDEERAWAWSRLLEIAATALPDELLATDLETWTGPSGDSWRARDTMRAVTQFVERVGARRQFGELLRLECNLSDT